MLLSKDSRRENIKGRKDTLGFDKLKFQLVRWGLNRFHSEIASYASPVVFLQVCVSEKQVVAGQNLFFAHRQIQGHDEKAFVCPLANHTLAKKNKK